MCTFYSPRSWRSLTFYNSIVNNADTTFTVIINPDNGPGQTVWPAGEYIEAIKSINAYPNVRTLGYIDTAGGSRDNAAVRKEIETYAGWSNITDSMALHGIYFDHTPYKNEDDAAAYLRNISATVRHSQGYGEDPLVVHSPGHVPEPSLVAYKPDILVLYEGVYANMPTRDELKEQRQGLRMGRDDLALLVHSVPKSLGRVGLRKIIDQVRKEAEWLYLTDLSENIHSATMELHQARCSD
jgi:hypothetical protein